MERTLIPHLPLPNGAPTWSTDPHDPDPDGLHGSLRDPDPEPREAAPAPGPATAADWNDLRMVVLARLLELPRLLVTWEREYLEAQERLQAAKAHLLETEDTLLRQNAVPGSNKEVREAHLRDLTREPRAAAERAQAEVARRGLEVRLLHTELAATRGAARLLAALAVDETEGQP